MKKLLLAIIAMLFSVLALAAVNINNASKEELDSLKGIGPVKAQAIIDYRNHFGPFESGHSGNLAASPKGRNYTLV